MNIKINAMYFSPTGTTEKIVGEIAKKITDGQTNVNTIDFTLPKTRKEPVFFTQQDLVVIGVPVYAGRVPNVLVKYLNTMVGNGASAIAVVVYGNRNYDDALIELKDILESDGFKVMGAGAFIGEHSFSKVLAQNRPDEKDLAIAGEFAVQIRTKLRNTVKFKSVNVKGNKPYRNHYVPKDENNMPVDIRKVTPKTNSDCIDCKLCADVCPMGSIDYEQVSQLNGICIKCGACIKKCPVNAKYYDDKGYIRHKLELENNFVARKEPELFL